MFVRRITKPLIFGLMFFLMSFSIYFLISNQSIYAATQNTQISTTQNSINLATSSSIVLSPDMVVSSDVNITSASVVVNNLPSDASITYTAVSGITVSYNSSKGVYTLTGSTTAANYQALFRSFTLHSGSTYRDNISLSFTINTGVGNATYFDVTGHYYEYISYYTYWTNAKANAQTRYFNERQGYLVTITSALENEFVAQKLSSNGWIGASDETFEGLWKWVTGPEAGQTLSSTYQNWASGEPNNSNNEDYAQFYVGTKNWNDLGSSSTQPGYIIEYGGLATDQVLGDYEETITVNIKQSYTLKFLDYNGISLYNNQYIYGDSLSNVNQPTPSDVNGYSFVGWNQALPSTMPNYNVTILPNYQAITYHITYDLNDGVATNNLTTYTIEDPTIYFNNPIKEGYTFIGWTNQNGSWVSYIPTGSYGDLVLTAHYQPISYDMIFESNGGSDVSTITLGYELNVNRPLDPIKEGYTFDGWYSDQSLKTPYTFTTMPLGGITLYAKWTVNQYTISFNSNGGSTIDSITLDYGDLVIAPEDPSREGYTFNGWDQAIPLTMPAEDLVITPSYSINSYSITFESNGGSLVDDITSFYMMNVNPPFDPTKEGYTFGGWYSDSLLQNPYTFTTMPLDGITLYARWLTNTYTITFNTNGGTEIDQMQISYGESIVLPEDPSRDGYTFAGWDQVIPLTMPAEDLVLAAIFNINSYSITFESNGGSLVDDMTTNYMMSINPPLNPTKDGYTFGGWYSDSLLQNPYTFTTMPLDGLTLYAKWDVITYHITYELNGGINSLLNIESYTVESLEFNLLDPTRTGYSFDGWYLDSSYDTLIETIEPSTLNQMILYAKWNANPYQITFDTQGGSVIDPIEQSFLGDIVAPLDPTKDGYIFGGWYSDQSLQNAYTFTTMPLDGLTLYAKWDVVTYHITYLLNDGIQNENNPQAYTIEFSDIPLLNPTKEGYTFGGWFVDETYETQMDTILEGTYHDLILYAKWMVNPYELSFDTQGGSSNNAIIFDFGDVITFDFVPEKEGYTFDHWENLPAMMPANDVVITAVYTINQYTVSWLDHNGNTITTDTYDYQSVIDVISYQLEGYDFDGWYLDENYSTPLTEEMPSRDMQVYPKMIAHTFDFTVIVNHQIYTITITSGEAFVDDLMISIDGLEFMGWYTLPNGMGEKISDQIVTVSDDFMAYPYFISTDKAQKVSYDLDTYTLTMTETKQSDHSIVLLMGLGIFTLSLFILHRSVSKKDVI